MDHLGDYFIVLAIGSVAAFTLVLGFVSVEDALRWRRSGD